MLVEHVFNNRQLSWFSALKALVAQVCGKGSISGPLTQGGDQALHCYLRSTHPRRLRVGSRALHCYLRSTHPSRLRVGTRLCIAISGPLTPGNSGWGAGLCIAISGPLTPADSGWGAGLYIAMDIASVLTGLEIFHLQFFA